MCNYYLVDGENVNSTTTINIAKDKVKPEDIMIIFYTCNSSRFYEKIDYLKTGCLFSLALVSGCIIADRKADIDVWRNVGFKLGLAFQIS